MKRLAAFAVAALVLAPAASWAASTDVTLTVDPSATLNAEGGSQTLVVRGTVSCSSTTVFFDPLVATVRQGDTELTSVFSQAECDPSIGSGSWGALFFTGDLLRPGQATVEVTLTLADGTVVTATGTVRLGVSTKPFFGSEPVDDTYINEEISNFCGFAVQEHDVGLQQISSFRDINGVPLRRVEHFVGTVTYTNLETGGTVELTVSGRFTTTSDELVFTGLNFATDTSRGQLNSAGRGVEGSTGESATPNLIHESEVICDLLAAATPTSLESAFTADVSEPVADIVEPEAPTQDTATEEPAPDKDPARPVTPATPPGLTRSNSQVVPTDPDPAEDPLAA